MINSITPYFADCMTMLTNCSPHWDTLTRTMIESQWNQSIQSATTHRHTVNSPRDVTTEMSQNNFCSQPSLKVALSWAINAEMDTGQRSWAHCSSPRAITTHSSPQSKVTVTHTVTTYSTLQYKGWQQTVWEKCDWQYKNYATDIQWYAQTR